MLKFNKFTLENGLRVIVHEDTTSPLVSLNILYDVGARDENKGKTGFAHLFEHLMFEGSKNIPTYDVPLQKVGGNNNAFTNNDITNYYLTLPAKNIETACWLESDRMLELGLTQEKLDIQKKVVIEEFKQRYLNQPYGDAWLQLRPLAYKNHPYQWATIGKEISHIEDATLEDVKNFYKEFYSPNNAILCFAGNTNLKQVKELTQKWFAPIPSELKHNRDISPEPKQTEYRSKMINGNVPINNLYRAYHMCDRKHENYQITDLISDILSNGDSSRFYQELVKDKKVFTEVDAYITGNLDNGLFVIEGSIAENKSIESAQKELDRCINRFINNVEKQELEKVKNKIETAFVTANISNQNIALNLCFYELLGDAALINKEVGKYQKTSLNDIKAIATSIFQKVNCSEIIYKKK
jgi:zinc protease